MAVVLAGMAGVCVAQRSLGIENTKAIKEEEVPVNVIVAFQKEVANPPEGTWNVHFVETVNGTKAMLWPLNYYFKESGRKGKIIARFSPEGKVEYARDTQQPAGRNGGV